MLTDDDLTRDLRTAFHDAADRLTYDGAVPTVRRTPAWARAGWLALPAAAAVAAAAVVVSGTPPDDITAPPAAAPSVGAPSAEAPGTTASSDASEPELVTERIKVMGMTLAYERPADAEPSTFTLTSPKSVPEGAREITFPGMEPARAWVTTENGRGVLYLDSPTRNNGNLMAMSSPGFDEAAMEDLLKNGWTNPS